MHPPEIHHLHLNSTSPHDAAHWYAKHFDMRAVDVDASLSAALLKADETRAAATLLWSQAAAPATSVGSTLDHYGWSVVDVDRDTARLIAAGCELVSEPVTIGPSPTGETLRISFLIDPFGAKLELVADPDLMGFHHIHLLTPTVEADRAQWIEAFGGRAETFKGFLPGIRYANGWALFRPAEVSLDPTRGRAIDHLAFKVDSANTALSVLQSKGLETTGPEPSHGGRTIGFVDVGTGASGAVTVELVEEPSST